uniref:Chemokine interleukin-8-like domain-containing protein n=1 Tax=Oreochromis aureus TaxID=47969 RepID=A0A668VDJ1_OREAU
MPTATTMNSVTAFVACLLILGAQGSKSNKCKCYSYIGRISPKLIKAEPVIHYPSIFCPHTEIIVTTKADMKKCVNPESPLGRHILKNHNKLVQ